MDNATLESLEARFRSLLSKEVARMQSMGLQTRPEDETDRRRLRLHYTLRQAQRLLAGLDLNRLPQGVDKPAFANVMKEEGDRLENSRTLRPPRPSAAEHRENLQRNNSITKETKKRKRTENHDGPEASRNGNHKKQKKELAEQPSRGAVVKPSPKRKRDGWVSVLEQCICTLWGIECSEIISGKQLAVERLLSPQHIFNLPLILHDIQSEISGDLEITFQPGGDWRSQAASFCREIKSCGINRKADFNVFYARIGKLYLYRFLAVEGHINPTKPPAVASDSPYPSNTVMNFIRQGKRLNMMCGGHVGLVFLLPLLRDDGKTGVPHMPKFSDRELNFLSALIRKARTARTLCSLGLNMIKAARSGKQPPSQELRDLSLQLMDTDCLDVEKILNLLKPWAARPCECSGWGSALE
ncbi:unnamed protein product [Clonostachys rosea]|uniref:HNH nuclease domain-containing protein n=1 Tax=Bionectria ochroleuca TaxID=29856 RepID=A0ABY6U8K0_BIOOC|nr:unnamed protein product [Clonostachys rosea]